MSTIQPHSFGSGFLGDSDAIGKDVDGQVETDHGKSAVANLKAAGEGVFKEGLGVPDLLGALIGKKTKFTKSLMIQLERPGSHDDFVRSPGGYFGNLGAGTVSLFVGTALLVKDLADVAIHGVLAGLD